MSLKMPTSEQKESMDFLFRTRNHHKDNFIQWLDDCREASIKRVIGSDPENLERNVGILHTIEEFKNIIEKF